MDEIAILSNIATIIANDIVIDNNDEINALIFEEPAPTLLESDDEVFSFFAKRQQQQHHRKCKKRRLKPTIKPENAGYSRVVATNNLQNSKPFNRIRKPKTPQKHIELNLLNRFGEDFERHMHINKMTFLKIFKNIRGILQEANFLISNPQTVFSLALWKLTTDDHYQEIERKFHIPIYESQTMMRQFWRIVSEKYQTSLSWPGTNSQRWSVSKQSQLKCFENLIGIVALKRWHVFLESLDKEVAVMLQIVCDANEKILDCHIEEGGEYSFDNTPIAKDLQNSSSNGYLIGGNCFPLRSYLIRPYGNKCVNDIDDDATVKFDRLLKSAIEIGENTLNAMALRFNSLYALEAKDLEEIRKIATTVCSLHNLCIEAGDDYVKRHKGSVKFNWASSDSSQLYKYGDESNEDGIRRRHELMSELTSNN